MQIRFNVSTLQQFNDVMNSLAVLHASQLVTLAGPKRPRIRSEMSEMAIVHDGGMLVHDGVIVAIGSSAEIEKSARQSEIIDAGGRVVLPGFVDAHAHPVKLMNRSQPPGAESGQP
jgi:imidazolonepropionase